MAFREPNPPKSRSGWAILLGACLMVTGYGLFSPALAHQALTTYEGSKTCSTTAMPCRQSRWRSMARCIINGKAPPRESRTWRGQIGGKWGSINDFCTYPNINFLFQMTNLAGATVVTGCGSCHAGRGLPPSPIATQEQLDNIDCLMCHSDLYKRVGAILPNGQPGFINDPTMNIGAATAAIQKTPSRATCLTRCHVSAGGGPGFKQGDIDPLQLDPPRTLDVHMASVANGGAGLIAWTATRHTTIASPAGATTSVPRTSTSRSIVSTAMPPPYRPQCRLPGYQPPSGPGPLHRLSYSGFCPECADGYVPGFHQDRGRCRQQTVRTGTDLCHQC